MIKLDIIRKSQSNYINLILVGPEKENKVTLCLDVWKLNEKLLDYFESPPLVDDISLHCTEKPFISSLDLTSLYCQIGLSEESKKYTAFTILNSV